MMLLAAFCLASVIILGAILAHKMAVESLERLVDGWVPTPPGSRERSVPPLRFRSEVPVSDGASTVGERPGTAVAHDLGQALEQGNRAPRSAQVLPFVQKPARARPPLRLVGQPDGAA
jgi:hypothetical protein